tara:strand:- start:238 stop:420 length:183 start_codon:yes stop_codon:yes gene_type:complete
LGIVEVRLVVAADKNMLALAFDLERLEVADLERLEVVDFDTLTVGKLEAIGCIVQSQVVP